MAWADALDSMKRYDTGREEESQRYVILSDALARQLANLLRATHRLMHQDRGESA
jgi:hypothetical protein